MTAASNPNPIPARQSSTPRLGLVIASVVGSAVFVLVTATAALVTFIMPETFASTARVLTLDAESARAKQNVGLDYVGTQVELLRSRQVLEKAAAELNLAQSFGKKYGSSEPLRVEEVLALLNERIVVRQVRSTAMAEITVYSESPDEAAAIANQIAAAYCSEYKEGGARMVDRATPSMRPMRPNKPLNIGLGVFMGLLLGGLSGVLAFLVFFVARRKRPGTPPRPLAAG